MTDVLIATAAFRTPAKIRDGLSDPVALDRARAELSASAAEEISRRAEALVARGVGVLRCSQPGDFPAGLTVRGRPVVPYLYYRGDPQVLHRPSLAVSGSRDASAAARKAAAAVGALAATLRMPLVAGNARGVDTAAAEAAAGAGGTVILVAPEGILRVDGDRAEQTDGGPSVTLLSQFEPDTRWSAYNAMGRNRTICALGAVTVVVAAGEKGGSLDAGRTALSLGRPLVVMTYPDEMPAGNAMLIEDGGVAVASAAELRTEVERALGQPEQTTLL
ncbi:DNA-processing protein DprA [Gordonia crocea]|uniref:DNA-processing protein DprA n=1 Tax=Gordonia crocea TaxID=589162 RepID=UPI00137AC99D|nr:DNA-processing protein DprA [Gordonia crocea]